MADEMDGEAAMQSVLDLEEHFRVPLVLYYLQRLTYREISEVLDVPIGTVMSRLSRGKYVLRQRMMVQKLKQAELTNLIPSGESLHVDVAMI